MPHRKTWMKQWVKHLLISETKFVGVVNTLEVLIEYIRNYPCLLHLEDKLRLLQYQKNIEKGMYCLCKEDEMSYFMTYVNQTIPQHEDCSNIEQYPDDFSKLMHLVDLVLHIPMYYSAFKRYCNDRPALHKYIGEDVSFTDEMIGYVRIFVITFIVQSVLSSLASLTFGLFPSKSKHFFCLHTYQCWAEASALV